MLLKTWKKGYAEGKARFSEKLHQKYLARGTAAVVTESEMKMLVEHGWEVESSHAHLGAPRFVMRYRATAAA